jgi:hypothetical protein
MTTAITYFDRARSLASALMIAGGAGAIIGSFLDWVTIDPPPTVPDDQLANTVPYSGIEAGDGWVAIALGIIIIAAAIALATAHRRGFARLAFIACIVLGGLAFADARAVGDLESGISQRMDVVGEPDSGLGIKLVAVAALVGLIGSATGLAASPREPAP